MIYLAAMNVVMIGTGNVANVLGRKIKSSGHSIVQVAGRNAANAAALAQLLQSVPCVDFASIHQHADIYIIALSDTALETIGSVLKLNGLVVHTAGAVTKNVLHSVSAAFGVLYPLQSLRSDRLEIPEIPFLLDANSTAAIALLDAFANTISDNVVSADDDKRMKMHTAAVIANNFTNYLYTLTNDFCKKEGISFSLLAPLLEETVSRLKDYDPAFMQTGPAVRNDQHTISKHLNILDQYSVLKKVYAALSDGILDYYAKK